MSELLPCPFCGRQPEVIHYDTENDEVWCEWEMMTELLPCPHHEEAIYPKRIAQHYPYPTQYGKEHWIVSYECPECGWGFFERSKTEQEADEAAARDWNTRYERTCQMTDNRSGEYASYDCQEHCYICSSCYSEFTLIYLGEDGGSSCEMPVYCPTCGAKVVDP